jgi:hypothetical protein
VVARAHDVNNLHFAVKSEIQRGDLEKAIKYAIKDYRFNSALLRLPRDDQEITIVGTLEHMGVKNLPGWEEEKEKLYKKAIENYGQFIESCKTQIVEEPKRIIKDYENKIKGYKKKISELKKEVGK